MKNIKKDRWYAIVRIDTGQNEADRHSLAIVAISNDRSIVYQAADILNKEIGNDFTPTMDEVRNEYGLRSDHRQYVIDELDLTPKELEKFQGKIIGQPGFHFKIEP